MYVCDHAVRRMKEHHKTADVPAVLFAVENGEPLDHKVAMAYLGRSLNYEETGDRYVLAPDCQGVFVTANDCVVTYLRLGAHVAQVLAQEAKLRSVFSGPSRQIREFVERNGLIKNKCLSARVYAFLRTSGLLEAVRADAKGATAHWLRIEDANDKASWE